MNHFFAIELPEDVRDELAAQVNRWRSELDRLHAYRWVEPRDYHITLKFLGDVSEAGMERAMEAAQPLAVARQPFKIRLAQAGSFKKRPTSNVVLWMGVRHDHDLNELAHTLDLSALDPYPAITFGQTNALSQRQYEPHVTIGRGNFTPEDLGYHMSYEHLFPSWQVTRFVLMQTLPPESRANGTESRYNTVHTFPLAGAHSSDVS